jgi:hypothetical protein
MAAYAARLRARGWSKITVWLSTADKVKLLKLARENGGVTNAIKSLL